MKRFHVWICLICFLSGMGTVRAAENGDTLVLNEEEIRAIQALKIADVLNNVPGVKAGDSSVSIHGSYKVKVFVDGRPLNDPTSSHGAVNWDLVSPDAVVRIEILRGKGGLAYGADASGGVILITTKNVHRWTGNIKTYGGNQNTRNVSAGVGTTVAGVTAGVTGGYETTDGYTLNNDKERYQAGLKLNYAAERFRNIGFSADYIEDDRGLTGLPEYPTPEARKKTRNAAYALQVDHDLAKSATAYTEGYNHNTDASTGLDKTLRVSKFGQDFTTQFSTFGEEDLACGTGLTWDGASGTGFDDQREHAFHGFVSQTLSFPRFDTTLTAGVRGSFHSVFDDVIHPEVQLVYKKTAWRLTAAYSRSNNTPSFYQRYNETSSTRPNPDLEMEMADNFNLALFTTPWETVSFSISVFYNLLTDRITYVTGEDGIGQYQNFGDVLYAGGDMAVGWKLHDTLKTKAAYTYIEVKDRETDLWVPGKARHNGHVDVFWQPLPALSLVAGATYSSEVYRDKNNTRTVPEYVTADLRAEYAFTRFSLFTEIKNIFDKTYFYADGLLGPPVTWVIGVNWRFG